MSPEDAFLAEIVEHPDDDAVRLVYADWLDERGDIDRADFIRVQIQRARLDEDDPAQADLERREQLLLKGHPEWLAKLPAWARSGAVFRRGFVEVISGAAGQVQRELGRVMRQAPVRDVTVHFSRGRPLRPFGSPEDAARVRRLCLVTGDFGLPSMIPRGFWPSLVGLEELALRVGQARTRGT
jgi:uncharacterized protein (TIGR02996 family)